MSYLEDPEQYFKEITLFLHEYNFVFKEANTDILSEDILMKMCVKFEIKPTEVIEYDNNEITRCENEKLKDLLNKIEYFRTNYSISMLGDLNEEVLSSRYTGSNSVPLGPKKRHEITRMSRVIHELCLKNDCNLIIDMGSGLGYLSQHLFTIYGYNVLGIESDIQRLQSAIKRQEKYHKTSIGKVKYDSHTITSHSNIYLQDLIGREFPNHDKICLIGLHACADLTIDAMKLFLNMQNAVGLVIMPCCFHKLSLSDCTQKCGENTKENESNTDYTDKREGINNHHEDKNLGTIEAETSSSPKYTLDCIHQSETGSQNPQDQNYEKLSKLNLDTDFETTVLTSKDFTSSSRDILHSIHASETIIEAHIGNASENTHPKTASEIEESNTYHRDDLIKYSERTLNDKNIEILTNDVFIGVSEEGSQCHNQDVIENIHPSMNSRTNNLEQTKSDREICQHFNYFPLSDTFREIFEGYNSCTYMKRPFLRLCCQPPCVDQPMDLLVFRLMSRAVLQLYAVTKNASLVKKKRRAVKRTETTLCDFDTFLTEAITNGYTLHSNTEKLSRVTDTISNLTEMSTESKSIDPEEFIKFNKDELQNIWRGTEKYKDMAAIYILLQRFFQPICENLLLHDRLMYLREKGCSDCKFVKISDEKISPRCMALIGSK